MLSTTAWVRTWIYLGWVFGWTAGARPQFDTSTNMGLVLVPADAEVDSVIFRLRATDQDADFPLIFDITAAVQPIVRVANLPCTLYNKVCQANVILTRRLVPGRLHDFAVRVRDSKGDSNSMQATISVTNATTPRDMIFPHVPSIIMVPEDTKPGKELDYLSVRANPWHGKPVYIELWQPKELFTIRQRQTPTQTRGVIILEGELDFETQSMYTLTMYATDPYTEVGKDTRNIAGVHVVVIVQDVQDVPPVFTIAPPLTRVNNSVKPGDVILRVHAEDGDKGTPREVTYGLVSEGNPFTPFFNISEGTGEIILARPLEELTQITHVGAPILLTVVAEEVRRSRDEPPGQATVVELGLLLGEPGNSPPYFESDSYMAWMDENAAPGTVVMFENPDLAKVRDEDIGKTGVFTLKLGNNNGTFEVTPTVAERMANFVVTVRDNTLLDYEVRKTVQFTVIAQEVGPATNLSASVPVTIFLRDINDNPPEFEKDTYEVTLVENVSPGTRVVQVHASDKDTGLSGSVRYTRIIGPGSETLTMDSETGSIVVAKGSTGLDREVTASLPLSVEACDENGRGLCSTVPLIVNLLDVNDNAPIFEKSVYEFVLNSEQTNFTSPAFIKATDADAEPPNNEVRYELVHGNYGNKFYLNEVTGELILIEPLNKSRKRRNNAYVNFATRFRSDFLQTLNTFQKIGVSTDKPLRIWKNRKKRATDDVLYTLTVRAYDSGVPHLSSMAKVRIITATPMGALTLMLVVPAEHLDPVQTTETLAAITGGRVTIQEIRPYDQPSDGTAQGGRMSIVVARVEPTMSGTFLVDVETIHKSLVANGMGIVPVIDSDTNSANEPPVSVATGHTVNSSGTSRENGSTGGSTGGKDKSNTGDGTTGSVNLGAGEGGTGHIGGPDTGTVVGDGETNGNTGSSDPGRPTGGAIDDKTNLGNGGNTGKENAGRPVGGTSGSSGKGPIGDGGDNTSGGTGGVASGDNSGGSIDGTAGGKVTEGTSGGTDVGIGSAEGKGESSAGGVSGGTAGTVTGGIPGGTNAGIPGGQIGGSGVNTEKSTAGGTGQGTNDQTGVIVNENINKINKTIVSSENEYIVYKAENKLLLWLLILLGLLMLLGLLALILCCICPGCPFYMAPRKRRVHSFETVTHPDSRPKRHIRRKQLNPLKAEWSGKKQAWSADPMRRNWQFNRRNTKNRGLASLPGDVAFIETPEAVPKGPALRLRDGPESWSVQYPTQMHKEDRLYVEDVEAGRTYDTEDVDSMRRHEMERGSDVLRHSYHQTDEISRLPRGQHFYRDGNAEVLRLVTGGHIEGEDLFLQAQRPTTLVSDQQALGYRSDGKDILLRRFIEDQKIRQHQDLHSSVQGICADSLDPRRQAGEQFLQKHEVIIVPSNLEPDHRHHREERAPSMQRLIIDHGDIDLEEEVRLRNQQLEAQQADLQQQQRKIAAAMLVGTAVSKATENPKANMRPLMVEPNPPPTNIPSYTIHDVELAKQNALLTQLLMDRDARHLGVPGIDPGSYLETQSLPGQVAIATQTDRTAATQTENRSRSDNEESEEEIRSRRKSKLKKRIGSELRRSRTLWLRSPIQEETRSISETRASLLRRKAKEAREGRRATLEPDVLREISDSLDEQASTPSPDEAQDVDRQLRRTKKAEYQSEERGYVDEEEKAQLSEIPAHSSPDLGKDKYHRRSHAKAIISEASQAHQKLESGSTRKRSSSDRSKTRSQKTEANFADTKKAGSTKSDRKESEGTSTDAKTHSKKRSTESQSNNSGAEGKKDTENKKKSHGKFLSKVGLLKFTSDKTVKASKSQETEEAPIAKKRTMLRHLKAKKVSTESSEFEEIPVKPRQFSLKAKAPKQPESNSKQDPAKGKKTSTLSEEPKSRSSGTDPDRLSQGYEKLSDSTSSTAATGQEVTKIENTTVAKSRIEDTKENGKLEKNMAVSSAPGQSIAKTMTEVIKQPISTVLVSQGLKSKDIQVEDQSVIAEQLTAEEVSAKREEVLSQFESEVLKSNTASVEDQSKKLPNDEPKIKAQSSDKSEKVSQEINTGLPKANETSSTEKEAAELKCEELSKAAMEVPDVSVRLPASESGTNDLPIEKKLESSAVEGSEAIEKIPVTVDAAKTRLDPADSESHGKVLPPQKEPGINTEKRVETKEVIPEEPKRMGPDVSKSGIELLSGEKQSEASTSEIQSTGERLHDKPEEISLEVNPPVVEAEVKIAVGEKQPEQSTKEVTEAFLQSEAMQSSYDSQLAPVEAKDHLKISSAVKNVTPDAAQVDKREIPKEETSESKDLMTQKIGGTDASTSNVTRSKGIESPVKSTREQHDSFIVIGQPETKQETGIDEEKHSGGNGLASSSPTRTESENKLVDNSKTEREDPVLSESISGKLSTDPLESSQRLANESPTAERESIEQSGIEVLEVKDGEKNKTEADNNRVLLKEHGTKDTGRKSPGKKSDETSEEDNFPRTTGESPSFYILSSGSSAEDFIPDQGASRTVINSDKTSSEKAATPVPDISHFSEDRRQPSGEPGSRDTQDILGPTETQSKSTHLANVRPAEWDPQQIQIGDISSDSPDNSRPYQTPRHRSRNRTGDGEETENVEVTLNPDQSKMKNAQLTPRLIAEEAIRSGLQEIIDSDALKGGSSSQTSSKTSPENQNQRTETSRRRPGKVTGDKKKSKSEKGDSNSQPRKKIEETREAEGSLRRPKTEPKGGNPRQDDTQVRPRTQRGSSIKPNELPVRDPRQEPTNRRSKPGEKSHQGKPNPEKMKAQDSPKPEEGATPKEGYMSRYKQKREEMERKRRELKEAAEEEQRPRWQRKPVVIPVPRVPGKETLKNEKPKDPKTPEGATPRTLRRLRIKPLANAESDQLRAMVKEGRRLRRAEGGDSDDPTVEIFASEPPAKFSPSFQPALMQQPSYVYESIPAPFYLHPPPPPHSSPQVSPQHVGPLDPRRPDDDLDSGIAVSLQGGTKLRHQQLLEKKSVFDIAYSEAAPSHLRTDSTTPPS